MTHGNANYTNVQPVGRARRLAFILFLAAFSLGSTISQVWAFPVSPTTLSFSASTGSPTPPAQTVTFSKNSLTSRPWTASGNAAWLSVSPSSGSIAREQDQIAVQVNATGLPVGTYSGTVSITVTDKNGRNQVTPVAVSLAVSGTTATSTSSTTTSTPSILLNPVSLSFSGTAGGATPLAQTFNITNPTGGTLTWTLTESASWLGLNVSSGTTTTEIDAISASVSTSGLAAGTYSTAITIAASGASNSPQTIPVILTLSAPTIGSASLTWDPITDTSLAGYNLYLGTQPGVYGPPISVGLNTAYTAGNLTGGKTYYFSVTAVNTTGAESAHSNEVNKTIQ